MKKNKRKENNNTFLKLLGMFIEVIAFFIWGYWMYLVGVSGVVGIVENEVFNLSELSKRIANAKTSWDVMFLTGGIVYLILETINYSLYLKKDSKKLFRAIIIEAIIMIVGLIITQMLFMFPILIVPIITGIIKLLILKREK